MVVILILKKIIISPVTVTLCILNFLTFLNIPTVTLIAVALGGYECYDDYDSDTGNYSFVYAVIYGCVTVPSDGNIYNLFYDGNGTIFGYPGVIVNIQIYIERGCAGDIAQSITYSKVDVDRDGLEPEDPVDAQAIAMISAGPCGSFGK